jgi:hypothetical protein
MKREVILTAAGDPRILDLCEELSKIHPGVNWVYIDDLFHPSIAATIEWEYGNYSMHVCCIMPWEEFNGVAKTVARFIDKYRGIWPALSSHVCKKLKEVFELKDGDFILDVIDNVTYISINRGYKLEVGLSPTEDADGIYETVKDAILASDYFRNVLRRHLPSEEKVVDLDCEVTLI